MNLDRLGMNKMFGKKSIIHRFSGGIFPMDGGDKLLSRERRIKEYIPQIVEISMEQSNGNVCKLIGEEGDYVRAGQIIGLPSDPLSCNIHASISGIITRIDKYKNQKDELVSMCVIESTERESEPYQTEIPNNHKLTKKIIIELMKQSGLIGMGGAGFPVYLKYLTGVKIKTVLINGVECEPYLTCDDRLMIEMGDKILSGIKYLLMAADCRHGILCIEENKPEAVYHMRELISNQWREEARLEVVTLPAKYPQGGERQLIYSVLGIEVPKGKIPQAVSVIVNNVATAAALSDAIDRNIPVIKRIVTVTGDVTAPCNLLVPIGARYGDLIEAAGGTKIKNNKVIIGGPMTGICIGSFQNEFNIKGSIKKTTLGILILKDSERLETNCIRCGACEKICPSGLSPFKIDAAYIKDNLKLCSQLQAVQCIGCGSCSYICPAKRNLAYRIVAVKGKIKEQEKQSQSVEWVVTSKGGR